MTETDIVTQPERLTADDATERISENLLGRVKRVYTERDVTRVERRYKPFYEFDAELRKKVIADEDIVYDGVIVVDAKTGVSRPLLKEHVETETRTVPERELLETELTEDAARDRAWRQKLETQNREGGKIHLANSGRVVYKPIWLVELETDDVRVVDATNGQLYGEMTIG